jgi:acetyltransferase-like isoleucine patch superfamily enzyme
MVVTGQQQNIPASCRVGRDVRLQVGRLTLGENVIVEHGVTIVGDRVEIGEGTRIGRGTDLRAADIIIGSRSEIAAEVSVLVAEQFEIGSAARISSGCRITCRRFVAGRLLYLGDGTTVGFGGTLTSRSTVAIGNRVTIGQFTILNANLPIEIGDGVGTGSYLAIWTHGYHFGHGPLTGSQPAYAPVRVGRNVWLGFQVTILPGVVIGDDSMIAAGAVVARDIPARVLAGGVPASVKKSIDVSPVRDAIAFDAVADVLRVWRGELIWKGCSADSLEEAPGCLRLRVRTADRTDQIVVELTDATSPPTAGGPGQTSEPGSPAVLLNPGSVDHDEELDPYATVFDLRSGRLRGRRSVLVEDLRDQLRRHAMPCGDDVCFQSIEPEPFRRLRAAQLTVPQNPQAPE